MLTAKQVGPLLGLSPRKVYELVREKRITFYDFGGCIRFDSEDVNEYKRATSPPPRPLPTGRNARMLVRMNGAIERLDGIKQPALPPEWQAMADERVRNLRRAPWADPAEISAIYAEARRLTAETGIEHHVDHEIPLLGTFVSGLHVETNLRVITARDNILKSNRFEVE
jgi:excisionase family DNA binding protein